MKVELDNLRLGISGLTETAYVGIPDNEGKMFIHKKDVTSDFLKAVIEWGAGFKRTVKGEGVTYEITVKRIENPKPENNGK